MPRDRMYVRRFLNEPGHHGGAYLLLSVPDTEGAPGSYVESSVRFEIAHCARNVQLEFPLHDAAARRRPWTALAWLEFQKYCPDWTKREKRRADAWSPKYSSGRIRLLRMQNRT